MFAQVSMSQYSECCEILQVVGDHFEWHHLVIKGYLKSLIATQICREQVQFDMERIDNQVSSGAKKSAGTVTAQLILRIHTEPAIEG